MPKVMKDMFSSLCQDCSLINEAVITSLMTMDNKIKLMSMDSSMGYVCRIIRTQQPLFFPEKECDIVDNIVHTLSLMYTEMLMMEETLAALKNSKASVSFNPKFQYS
jgi:hypothetical protein